MDSADHAALEHANMIHTFALAGTTVDGALLRRSDGVVLIATGMPLRPFNQVLVEDDRAAAGTVTTAIEAMRARRAPYVVNLRVGTDDDLLPLMAELGLVPLSDVPWMPGMALWPIPADAAPESPPGHEIRRVTDAAGLADHVATVSGGFGIPVNIIARFMTPAMIERPEAAIYVGYQDGEPVTAGMGIRTGRTIGVYNIATVEVARSHGYGAAMTRRVAADGAQAGCDVAILQASEMGFPIYRRLGYRTVVEYMGYIDPPDPTEADPA